MIAAAGAVAVDHGGRRSVERQLQVAFDTGWTPTTLATWMTRKMRTARSIGNPAGFVVAQLRSIPAPSEAGAGPAARPDWCGSDGSDGGEPCDPITRQRERASDGALYRCPICHPLAATA